MISRKTLCLFPLLLSLFLSGCLAKGPAQHKTWVDLEKISDTVVETKKVVWPSRKETMQTTGIVFAFVLVMAIVLWMTDKGLEWVLYDLVLGWKKS